MCLCVYVCVFVCVYVCFFVCVCLCVSMWGVCVGEWYHPHFLFLRMLCITRKIQQIMNWMGLSMGNAFYPYYPTRACAAGVKQCLRV